MYKIKYSGAYLSLTYGPILIFVLLSLIGINYIYFSILFNVVYILVWFALFLYKYMDDYLDRMILEDKGIDFQEYKGPFTSENEFVNYDDVVDIKIIQNILGKILNYGNIEIITKHNTIRFNNVSDVKYVKEMIEKEMIKKEVTIE